MNDRDDWKAGDHFAFVTDDIAGDVVYGVVVHQLGDDDFAVDAFHCDSEASREIYSRCHFDHRLSCRVFDRARALNWPPAFWLHAVLGRRSPIRTSG